MRRFIVGSLYCLVATIACAQMQKKEFSVVEIDVSALEDKPDKFIINYASTLESEDFLTDTLALNNGLIRFDMPLNEMRSIFLITIPYTVTRQIILKPGKNKIVFGNTLSEIRHPTVLQTELDSLTAVEKSYFDRQSNPFERIRDNVYKNYTIVNGSSSPLSLYSFIRFAGNKVNMVPINTIDSVYGLLALEYQQTPTGLAIKKKIEDAMKVSLGRTAPEFKQPDINGKNIPLSSLRGKYVLVDFWASWCHPCREEHPNLVKAYEKHKKNKFQILSVSLDSKSGRAAWLKAIQTDKVGAWLHVSDLLGWKNEAALLYNITFVPANFLLDPEGKIIAMDLRGNQLEEKLDGIFNSYPYELTVDLSAVAQQPEIVVLKYRKFQGGVITPFSDTIILKNRKKVVFKGNMYEPIKLAGLQVSPQTLYSGMDFYLQSGKTNVVCKEQFSNAVFTGPFQKEISQLDNEASAYDNKFYSSLSEKEKNVSSTDEDAYIAFMTRKDSSDQVKMEEVYKPFIIANARTNPFSVIALERYAGDPNVHVRSSALSTLDSLYQLLSPEYKNTLTANMIKKRIDKGKKVSIGQMAPAFSQPDTAGNMISLSSFRGRYVFVDFWASWCHWCRVENPGLIKLFNQYHAKGFDVLGVSLDDINAKKAWLKAIEKDKTGIWTQVCEFPRFDDTNTTKYLYGIDAIPQNFLIDPTGKIIGVNLYREKLSEKLEEIF